MQVTIDGAHSSVVWRSPLGLLRDDDKRAAWDGKRYGREAWVNWYHEDGDEYFALAPDWRGLDCFLKANCIRMVHRPPGLNVMVTTSWHCQEVCHWRCFGVVFACHLVIMPVELKARFGYLRPDSLPRKHVIYVENEHDNERMSIYDWSSDVQYFTHVMQCPLWCRINYKRIAGSMYDVVMDPHGCQIPDDDLPFYSFLGIAGVEPEVSCDCECHVPSASFF